ncbi:MAG: glycosyltransferase family 2 protein [Bacteroidales bacterium]|nr:glycosyltransferase family 2 protein [Bacteroidales bacterium]
MKISIVSPIYKGEKMLHHLVNRCEAAMSTITDDYELVLVNDCSPDNSWEVLKEICAKDKNVKAIDHSRNFGQHPAISTGLRYATGDWVVVMDCDLQDRPEDIPALYAKAQEGWDVVFARRGERHDGFFKQLGGKIFHLFFRWLTGIKTDKNIGNFSIFRKSCAEEIVKIPDLSRSFGTLIRHVGGRTTFIDVDRPQREEGTTGYTLSRLMKLAFENSISNSNKPLRLVAFLGFIMSVVSGLLALYQIIAKLAGLITVSGYTSTIASIWFVGGLILFVLGTIGLYVGKIYDQVKGRPYSVVRETINISE